MLDYISFVEYLEASLVAMNHREQDFLGSVGDKESACQCKRHKKLRVWSLVKKIPWSRKWELIPVFLPGKFHGQRSLEGYRPWGHEKSWTQLSNWEQTHIQNIETYPSEKYKC